jgi:hypothetical protein
MSQQQNIIAIQKEGRLELALQAYTSGQFKRLRRAVRRQAEDSSRKARFYQRVNLIEIYLRPESRLTL